MIHFVRGWPYLFPGQIISGIEFRSLWRSGEHGFGRGRFSLHPDVLPHCGLAWLGSSSPIILRKMLSAPGGGSSSPEVLRCPTAIGGGDQDHLQCMEGEAM